MAYQAPKGTRDVQPGESARWQYVESLIREITRKYGFVEARTPIIEHTELFLRGVGDTTDIVQKEMYSFTDKGGRSITLRPEGTAGMVRMFVEHGLCAGAQPTKLYYLAAPVFRYERPQAGRLREHHQFGVEMFGASSPTADAECILLALELFKTLGCSQLTVRINNIGCPQCRPKYQAALREYLASRKDELCQTCQTRYEKNPLRILDCKVPQCGEIVAKAPSILDYVCDDCREHFSQLLGLLDSLGVRYEVTPTLVRGLDYYTKTVFEIVSDCIGAQGTVCGGGRYDHLVKELGGPDLPAVGFGLGMERLLLLMEQLGVELPRPRGCELYIANRGEDAGKRAFVLAAQLRALGHAVDIDHAGRSVKAQFKFADKLDAENVLTIGDDELARGAALMKRLSDGTELETALDAAQIDRVLKGE